MAVESEVPAILTYQCDETFLSCKRLMPRMRAGPVHSFGCQIIGSLCVRVLWREEGRGWGEEIGFGLR